VLVLPVEERRSYVEAEYSYTHIPEGNNWYW